jgi:hypothetical protein
MAAFFRSKTLLAVVVLSISKVLAAEAATDDPYADPENDYDPPERALPLIDVLYLK